MAKKQDKSWQYTFSTVLAAATLLLVLGYFVQSFIEIRKVKPVSVAIEKIKGSSVESTGSPEKEAILKTYISEDTKILNDDNQNTQSSDVSY